MAGNAIAGDTFVHQHRGRCERDAIVASVAILCRRYVVGILHQIGAGNTRQRQEKTHVAAFATVGNSQVNIIPEVCGRREIARVGGAGVVAHNALAEGRNMVGFLAYGPNRNIAGIATVAGFAVTVNAIVEKVGCILERQIRIRVIVARETVLRRRQMSRCLLAGGDSSVMA